MTASSMVRPLSSRSGRPISLRASFSIPWRRAISFCRMAPSSPRRRCSRSSTATAIRSPNTASPITRSGTGIFASMALRRPPIRSSKFPPGKLSAGRLRSGQHSRSIRLHQYPGLRWVRLGRRRSTGQIPGRSERCSGRHGKQCQWGPWTGLYSHRVVAVRCLGR